MRHDGPNPARLFENCGVWVDWLLMSIVAFGVYWFAC
jgi:hypothetical protein